MTSQSYEQRREQLLKYHKERREKHRERLKEYSRKYYQEHKEVFRLRYRPEPKMKIMAGGIAYTSLKKACEATGHPYWKMVTIELPAEYEGVKYERL